MSTASKVRKIIGGILLVMCVIFMLLTISSGEKTQDAILFSGVYGVVALILIFWPTRKKAEVNTQQQMLFGSQPSLFTVQKKKNGVGSKILGCFVLAFVIVAIAGTAYVFNNPDKFNISAPESKTALGQLGVTAEQEDQINVILSQCGINNILSMERDTLLDDMDGNGEEGYRVATEDVKNIIVYLKDDQVYKIRYADNDIYSESTQHYSLSSFYMTFDEKHDFMFHCQNAITNLLKSPSTAKYPSYNEWSFFKSPDEIIIQGYVDAQNSFGAMIRSDFQFKLTPDGKTVTSLIFEGEERLN